jgi:carbon storage regulator CsrA
MSTHPNLTLETPDDGPGFGRIVEQVAGDSVVIGDVEITLLRVMGDRAHIAVNAPDGVAIARGEVYRERSRDYLT